MIVLALYRFRGFIEFLCLYDIKFVLKECNVYVWDIVYIYIYIYIYIYMSLCLHVCYNSFDTELLAHRDSQFLTFVFLRKRQKPIPAYT